MLPRLAEAVERGLLRAGFASVEVRIENMKYDLHPCIAIVARATCPCGELSSFGVRYANESMLPPVGYMEEHIHAMGVRHIEQDKAEGRWHD